MSKRKCVRRPIVELSDSEDDQADDDCVIVESNDADNAKNNGAKRTREVIPITDDNRQSRRSRVKRITGKEKEKSHDVIVAKKRESRDLEVSKVSTGDNRGAPRGRKRKSSDSEPPRMGSSSSKTRDREEERLRNIEKTEPMMRIQKQQAAMWQKTRVLEHYREYNVQEETRLKQEKEKWQFQENLPQQQQKLQRQRALLPQPSILAPASAPIVSAPKLLISGVPATRYAPPALTPDKMIVSAARNVLPSSKPKSDDTPETYLARLAASTVRCVEWTDIDYIQESHGLSRLVAENIIKLFQEDNTIPFIARYRKNMTLGMDADELRNIKSSYDKAKLIKQKANAIIKEIDKQGKWTAEFHAFVQGTKSLNDLEQIYSMFKVTKASLADRARDVGLGIPAEAIMKGEKIDLLCRLVKPNTEGLKTEEQVRNGIVCILADMINKDENTFERVKNLRHEHSVTIETNKVKGTNQEEKEPKTNKQKDDESKYDLYHKFSSLDCNLKPHQILAINRGESRKVLSVKVNVSAWFEQDFKEYCARQYQHGLGASPLHKSLLTSAVDYAWAKSIKSSVGRRTRSELNERAEIASMDVFAENVKQLLLTPPVRGKIVLGIDPGFRHGCKLAVVSEQGDMLETETIYPHDGNNPKGRPEAERVLARIVLRHKCTIFALGNGTACRETEVFLAELIKKRIFEPLNVVYTIVDETGASIYSCSREASTEFPDLDVNVVSAISIARRLQDPMAELVKIEPKHLGVGMYQHDLPEKQLALKLNEVIMEAVSFVGVDVNTASVSLLKRVAGLSDSKAKNIIEWRKSSGPFRTRKDLMKVPRIGSKTFEQCAGFIRIMPETAVVNDHRATPVSLNYLDQTWIHPESYDIANAFVKAANCNPSQLGTKSFIYTVKQFTDTSELAKKFNTTIETMRIIVEGLSMEKGQDIRAKADVSMFRKSLTSFDDLKVGTILTGVVRNNTHFGAFVDVGVERAGLIHKSQMGGITLTVGQRVETKVHNVEKARGRLGLTLIKCF